MNYCFGVDVGGTSVKIGLFQEDGMLCEKWEIPTRKDTKEDVILADIAASLERKCKERQIAKEYVKGIGMGVPTAVREDGFVKKAANLAWKHINVKQELERLVGVSVLVANDANVAALGEMWKGGAQGYQNLVMVTLGTGVGGGIITNGRILAGAHGGAGEIGHICVNRSESNACGCGKKGCLEQYASATGITNIAKKKIQTYTGQTSLCEQRLDAKTVFEAVKAGDLLAVEIAEECGAYLGHALADLGVILDPDIFVIGGGVSKAGDTLITYIEKYFQEQAFFACKDVKITLARLGNDAGIYGAAKLVL